MLTSVATLDESSADDAPCEPVGWAAMNLNQVSLDTCTSLPHNGLETLRNVAERRQDSLE